MTFSHYCKKVEGFGKIIHAVPVSVQAQISKECTSLHRIGSTCYFVMSKCNWKTGLEHMLFCNEEIALKKEDFRHMLFCGE